MGVSRTVWSIRSLRRSGVLALVSCAALLAGVTAAPAAPAEAAAPLPSSGRTTVSDPAQYVNPFVGTRPGGPDFGTGGGAGNTFPGAAAPLGMLQWSPDTVTYQPGGYFYDDHRIRGFSLTHLSGAGCGDYGNVPFLPIAGSDPVDHYDFSHADESAAPGSYTVTFGNGLKTELAATQRSGIARFTYPAGRRASLAVDAGRAFNKASGSVSIGTDSLSGYTESGGFCGADNHYRIYFTAVFDRPFATSGIVTAGRLDTTRKYAAGESSDDATPASDALALVSFDTSAGRTVTARVGISFVSAEGARANLRAEQGGAGFDEIRDAARTAWNGLLGRIAVGGGSTGDTRTFYTALYHSLLHPSVLSDVDGRYPGFDGLMHRVRPGHVQYADFSGWDVYRSQAQLLALLAPQEASDVAQSIVAQGTQSGYLDRWTLADGGTGVMVGDPLPVIAAGIHAFGGTDFDAQGLLGLAVNGSRDDRERPGHALYDRQGYLPADTYRAPDSVATTLEYTTADFALAQLAHRLGDSATHHAFLGRSDNWRNLFNSDSHYLQPRNADGSWPAFSPSQQNGFVEGSAAQYTWMVPYNHRALFDAMGGNDAVVSRLDRFFTELNDGPSSPYAFLGNEPSFNTPWAYDYAGRPDRTQGVVRRALTTLFSDAPDGEVGNDDLGEMSSWAVWAALGMYPQAPGRAELVLASPLFPAITIHRGNGATLDISAPNASAATPYVQALKTDGHSSQRPWVGEEFVLRGGRLEYALSADPNPAWGSTPQDAPPSFGTAPARLPGN
ncbi:GH92 family glycosyl hydrolase [Kitasatospora sp. GP82]|uniref:GH92 family glycosyl hydrolase n=1 Tax=Kitasatospora sp. GP82 TaxID=3035089 RepID=UPI002473F104|nr:GH92 family glycosyl hydrolase [Kitasatospora sp. GP82]MDH6126350.1 putative alpha-1,2-mannosidase [Kitasatospora sp. GP82]